ncbi:MAG: hypothetical protein U9P07_03105 [Pseudomonadota bacterium]|nr:hypothetical protein [Pseudomonadota bacterium]
MSGVEFGVSDRNKNLFMGENVANIHGVHASLQLLKHDGGVAISDGFFILIFGLVFLTMRPCSFLLLIVTFRPRRTALEREKTGQFEILGVSLGAFTK